MAALLPGAFVPAAAQVAPRPDSRSAAFPTAAPLPPPPRLRFVAVWEKELPGERVAHLLADGTTVIALTNGGRLLALRSPDGEMLWSVEGLDPAVAPSLRRGVIVARRHSDGATVTYDALSGVEGVPISRIVDIRTTERAYDAVTRPGGCLEMRDEARDRVLWSVRTGTDVGAGPLILTTTPGGGVAGSRQRSENLVIAGTMDGLLMAFGRDNGHLLWTKRMQARLSRPIAVWLDPDDPGADRTRLLVTAETSRRVEAVRAIDGAAAGSLVLEPEGAVVIGGPVVPAARTVSIPSAASSAVESTPVSSVDLPITGGDAPAADASGASGGEAGGASGDIAGRAPAESRTSPPSCVVAWSPYLPAGSRILSLRLVSGG